MTNPVIQFARTAYQNTMKDSSLAPQKRLYQLSMPLLAVATLKENDDYVKILADMEQLLNDKQSASQIEKPWQLWMLGRMAVASKLVGDSREFHSLKMKLSAQLFENDNKDVITGWAFAYLASLDDTSYKLCREKLFEYEKIERDNYLNNPEKEASNYVWTLVMNLYASANAGKEDYVTYLTKLSQLTGNKTLKATSLLVPESDYRQWLVSLERLSFAMMNDSDSLAELEAINSPEVNDFDSMLAWANTLVMPHVTAVSSAQNYYRFYSTDLRTHKDQSNCDVYPRSCL